MISTQDYYTYDDLTVGTAVACIHNGKKYVGNSQVAPFVRYYENKYSGCFVLLKDYKKYKELMKC